MPIREAGPGRLEAPFCLVSLVSTCLLCQHFIDSWTLVLRSTSGSVDEFEIYSSRCQSGHPLCLTKTTYHHKPSTNLNLPIMAPRTNMRAIILDHFGGYDALKYKDIPKPEPQDGHVLIQVG